MFALTLLRYRSDDLSTIGLLHDTSNPRRKQFLCYTLEDPYRLPKIAGCTRIPEGVYPLELRTEGQLHKRYQELFPGMHRGMVWIREVPDFEWVCLHIGNRERDTDGCPLVGSQPTSIHREPQAILQSEKAYRYVYPLIAHSIEANPKNSTLTVTRYDD